MELSPIEAYPVTEFEDIDTQIINISGCEKEVIKFNLENFKKFIDNSIRYWNKMLSNRNLLAHKKTQYSAFIESYQTIRLVIFGEHLRLDRN